MIDNCRIGIVIPCYKCRDLISNVLKKIPHFVDFVYVVDDACPQNTGQFVKDNFDDKRFIVITHEKNGGVGAATTTGYRRAVQDAMDICVKVDGDDQMDLSLLPSMLQPILTKEADYVKGNRFYYPRTLVQMPLGRLIGNACLSILAKISTGYYHIFDPTNGYTAIHRTALSLLEIDKLHKRFFFETDILFRLNIIRAVIVDVPMKPIYKGEKSNFISLFVIPSFLYQHAKNFTKRLIYSHVLRGFSTASIYFFTALSCSLFGLLWSLHHWRESIISTIPATTGTVMIGVLGLLVGFHSLIHFFIFDMAESPRRALQKVFSQNGY